MSEEDVARHSLAIVVGATSPRTFHVYDLDGNDHCLAIADAILASDWLAERDAANRLLGEVQAADNTGRAWDEAHDKFCIAALSDLVDCAVFHANPYRSEADADVPEDGV